MNNMDDKIAIFRWPPEAARKFWGSLGTDFLSRPPETEGGSLGKGGGHLLSFLLIATVTSPTTLELALVTDLCMEAF